MDKKLKPATEIRNLKAELRDLREVALRSGVPIIIVYMPTMVIRNKKLLKPPQREINWIKKMGAEHIKLFHSKRKKINHA